MSSTTILHTLKPLLQQARAQKKGRKATAKPVRVSRKLELQYSQELLAIARFCDDAGRELVVPEVSRNIGDGWFSRAIDGLRNKITAGVNAIAEKLARKTVQDQQQASDAQLADQLQKMTGIDLRGVFRDEDLRQVIDEAIAANVALIRSIPTQYADKIEAMVLQGLQEGKRAEAIAADIHALGQSTEARARLIARDQLGKINSRITQVRQQKLGVTHYTWSTSDDERVRTSHRARDGKIFAWNDPPPDGHAGQPIRCRCVALPYMDHLLDDDALSPEEAMKAQRDVIGNPQAEAELLRIERQQDISAIQRQSQSLLNDHTNGLTRDDLPHASDHAKGWTGGIMGLRKSAKIMNEILKSGKLLPASWAVHHWTIDSSFLVDRYRKSKLISEVERAQMEAVTEQADRLIRQLFDDPRSVIGQDVVLYRGISLDRSDIDEIERILKSGKAYSIKEDAFNSNSSSAELATVFATHSATRNNGIPVLYKTIVKSGVKGIDITDLNYYDEDEILIDKGYSRDVIAMKRHDNGMIELHSVMKPKADNIGDATPKHEKGREITICYEDAHMNKVSGVAITVSVGGLLKDYKF